MPHRDGWLPSSWPQVAAGETIELVWVPDAEIPRPHRREVRRYADKAARRLGLPRPAIRYFRPGSHDGAEFQPLWTSPDGRSMPLGMSQGHRPNTICIAADLRGPALEAVVYHEVAHRSRAMRSGFFERNANAFALELLQGGD